MTLPKTFSAALVRRLNAACAETQCECACGGIGWCQGCWDALGGISHDGAEPEHGGVSRDGAEPKRRSVTPIAANGTPGLRFPKRMEVPMEDLDERGIVHCQDCRFSAESFTRGLVCECPEIMAGSVPPDGYCFWAEPKDEDGGV